MQRIVLLGSHVQTYRCMKRLLEVAGDHEIVALVPNTTQPPIRADQDVRLLAASRQIPVRGFDDLHSLDFDLGLSVLFDRVLPPEIFQRPQKGFVNFHLGPLPRLRGSNSVLHAIILARKENIWTFGATLHYIEAKVDAGPIIDIGECPIFEDDTAGSLHARACDLIFDLFKRNINKLLESEGRVPSRQQDGPSRFFRKGQINHEVDLLASPEEVYDHIRALTFPGKPRPFAMVRGRKIFLSLE